MFLFVINNSTRVIEGQRVFQKYSFLVNALTLLMPDLGCQNDLQDFFTQSNL